MPEIENNESIETNESENAPRMFTQEEVDAIVKRRIDKQASKHNEKIAEIMAQLDEANGIAAAATKERDEMRRANEIREWAKEAAKEFGVPESLLRGESMDELKAHAQEIAAALGNRPYPDFRDSGASEKSMPSEKSDFIKQIFSN